MSFSHCYTNVITWAALYAFLLLVAIAILRWQCPTLRRLTTRSYLRVEASIYILFLIGTIGVAKSLWQQQKQRCGRSIVGVEPSTGRLVGIERNYYKDVSHFIGSSADRQLGSSASRQLGRFDKLVA